MRMHTKIGYPQPQACPNATFSGVGGSLFSYVFYPFSLIYSSFHQSSSKFSRTPLFNNLMRSSNLILTFHSLSFHVQYNTNDPFRFNLHASICSFLIYFIGLLVQSADTPCKYKNKLRLGGPKSGVFH